MGNFYVNYSLRGVTQTAVAEALAGRTAIVTPSDRETVVVFDEQSDSQNHQIISELAATLAAKLMCPVLAVLNHDDDILWYQLYTPEGLQDEYDSSPDYFSSDAEPSGPTGGDAARLCAIFGSPNTADVEKILRASDFDENGYAFAFERHADLVKALGISDFGVGTAYASFEADELPDGLSIDDVIRTP